MESQRGGGPSPSPTGWVLNEGQGHKPGPPKDLGVAWPWEMASLELLTLRQIKLINRRKQPTQGSPGGSLTQDGQHRNAVNVNHPTMFNGSGNHSQLKGSKAPDLLRRHVAHKKSYRDTEEANTPRVTVTEQNINTYRAGCFYIYFCSYFLASDPLFGCREVCTPAVVVSGGKKSKYYCMSKALKKNKIKHGSAVLL